MPASFDACVKGGGKVRTVSGPNKKFGLSRGQYIHVCINDSGLHRGYVKTKERARQVESGQRK